jgi:flagellar biosynthesis/type III secretory pathway protein FliH
MSSKLVRAGEAGDVVPIVWPADGVPLQTSRTSATGGGGAHALLADFDRQTELRVQAAQQQGFAAGEASASKRLDPALASLSHLIQELASTRKRFRADAEGDTVKLAIAIARWVLHRELATDPEAILGLVKAAFEKLNVRETHRLLRLRAATWMRR